MKKLSETYKELGIAFVFPIEIKNENGYNTYQENSGGDWYRKEYDSDGNETYYENNGGYWYRKEYDSNGNETYYESSTGYWYRKDYDSDGNETYYEDSTSFWGRKNSHDFEIIELNGKQYQLID